MADQKISELTDAGAVQDGDEFPLARAGSTLKASGSALKPQPFNGGTILLEVSAPITLLDNTQTACSFDPPYMDTTAGDVTLGEDSQTLTFNTTGWYQVWYSLACKASATTVKSQVSTVIERSGDNWIRSGSGGELQLHLDGSISLLDMAVTYMTPPIAFTAGDVIRLTASAQPTAGSVGDSILTANTYMSIVRIA